MSYNVQEIPINQLTLLERNPRKITKQQLEKLCNSIKNDPKFLFQRPVLVHQKEEQLEVYAGNQRVRAAKKLGWKTIPCSIEKDLTDEIIKERIIKDNKTYGEFDFDILANEWDTDLLLDAGFSADELIGSDITDLDSTEENDSEVLEPAKDEDAITKLGDVYELGGHIVICGDSTCPDGIIPHLENHQPIIMVTDPPYGVEYDPNWRKKSGKGQKAAGKVQNDSQNDWSIAYSIFQGSIVYIWCASWFLPEVSQNLKNCDFELKSLIIWKKQHFALSRGDYHWQHEPCCMQLKRMQS